MATMGNKTSKEQKNDDNDDNNNNNPNTCKFTEDDVIDVNLIDCGNYYLIPSDLDPEKDENVIKILTISDTHSKHSQIINIPSADILLHGGDFTNTGSLRDVKSYDKWVGDLIKVHKKFKYSVLIAGNHDITLEADYYNEIGYKRFHHGKKQNFKECINITNNGNNVYLLDETVELFGIKFYGSPYQPEFCQWAFNMTRGEQLKKEWAKIPDKGIDVLVTHGPPKFHGDKVIPRFASLNDSAWVGCDDLLQRMTEIEDVKFHIFGHIHEGYGVTQNKKIKDIIFINSSTVNVNYQCVNKPIMFYIKGRGRNFCDRKSLIDGDDVKDNNDDNNNDDEEQEEDDNTYKMVQDYDKQNDQNNKIDGDKDDNQEKINVDGVDETEPIDIPNESDQ